MEKNMHAFPCARSLDSRETVVQSGDESGKACRRLRLNRRLSNIDRRTQADDEMGMAGRQCRIEAGRQPMHAGVPIVRDEGLQDWRRQTGFDL